MMGWPAPVSQVRSLAASSKEKTKQNRTSEAFAFDITNLFHFKATCFSPASSPDPLYKMLQIGELLGESL